MAVGAQIVAYHPIPTQIENERIKPAALGSDLVGTALPLVEKDTPAIAVLQDQLKIPVLSAEFPEAGSLESNHVGLGQRHLGVEATEMAVVLLARVSPNTVHLGFEPPGLVWPRWTHRNGPINCGAGFQPA